MIPNRIAKLLLITILSFNLAGCSDIIDIDNPINGSVDTTVQQTVTSEFDYSSIPDYEGYPTIPYNNNVPLFTADEITSVSFEDYGEMDELGRCTVATACLGPETLPTEKRGSIGAVKPSGWHTVKYPDYISGLYLYNRCHLIAYELSAENANENNLVTGTRYLNIQGMLTIENATADYIKDTGNHVMYRSTPIFIGNELVCRGILMEGYSVEDNGAGLSFCIYAYNVQPHIVIDYATGDSEVGTTPEDKSGMEDPFIN